MKTSQTPTETQEQRLLVDWLRIRRVRFFSVPNGAVLGGRNRFALLAKLRAEGLLTGAPDLVLIDRAPTTGRPVAVEMKRRVGALLSNDQIRVHTLMRAAGWDVIVGWGAESAISQRARPA